MEPPRFSVLIRSNMPNLLDSASVPHLGQQRWLPVRGRRSWKTPTFRSRGTSPTGLRTSGGSPFAEAGLLRDTAKWTIRRADGHSLERFNFNAIVDHATLLTGRAMTVLSLLPRPAWSGCYAYSRLRPPTRWTSCRTFLMQRPISCNSAGRRHSASKVGSCLARRSRSMRYASRAAGDNRVR